MIEPVENLPPSRGHRHLSTPPPRLRPVEQALLVLITHRNQWFVVDRWPLPTHHSNNGDSAVGVALRRRGCEYVTRLEGTVVTAYARWTHEIPTGVAPWEEPA